MRSRVVFGLLVLGAACAPPPVAVTRAPSARVDAGTAPIAPLDAGGPVEVRALTQEDVCGPRRTSGPGYADLAPDVPEPDPNYQQCGSRTDVFSCNRTVNPRHPKDLCEVADRNLERAEGAIAAGVGGPVAASTRWQGEDDPQYFARVDAHLHLRPDEQRLLRRNGFVVLERFPLDSYATAYHDIFQQELPVYVSIDSILHTVYEANDEVIAETEAESLVPQLGDVVMRLSAALPLAAKIYPPEIARDLAVYVSVARALLLDNKPIQASLGTDDEVGALVAMAREGTQLAQVTLFGRDRMIDFTQYTPRGHYANPGYSRQFLELGKPGSESPLTTSMASYFRASMWLSRLELNLVSRSCRSSEPGAVPNPAETPREARVALALADLARRAGVLPGVERLDRAWGVFAGFREDVSIAQLLDLAAQAGTSASDPKAQEKLRAVIGDRWKRTARLHFMPQGSKELPVISTMLGPRVVPDAQAARGLVHDEVPDRYLIGAADVAFLLGHDRAKRYLEEDLRKFPTLAAQLDKARTAFGAPHPASGLYGEWLAAVGALGDKAGGALPGFTETEAFQDFRMNSAVVGFGQIRHNYVLIAGQPYDSYGCEIPDGYVEPALGTFDHLIKYASRARATVVGLASSGKKAGLDAYFARVGRVLETLRQIARHELEGRALTVAERRYVAMVGEYVPTGGYGGDSHGPPSYTGWYFDLFPDREHDAKDPGDFVSDIYTSTNEGKVVYLGATAPRLGVFVVDTGGAPRIMVGPVAHGYEMVGPLDARLDDAHARTASGKRSAWTASYTAAAPDEPPLDVSTFDCDATLVKVVARSTRDLGPVTVELLDHHGDSIAKDTKPVSNAPVVYSFHLPADRHGFVVGTSYAEGIHVRAGDFDYVAGGSVYRGSLMTVGSSYQSHDAFALGSMRKAEPADP